MWQFVELGESIYYYNFSYLRCVHCLSVSKIAKKFSLSSIFLEARNSPEC